MADLRRLRQPPARSLHLIMLLVAAAYCIKNDVRVPEKVLAWREVMGLMRGRGVDRFLRDTASPMGGGCLDGSLRKRGRKVARNITKA